MAYSGRYTPDNPQKYKGDHTSIFYRSLWERNVMVKLDTWDAVIEWSSEELHIPYRSPKDDRVHRYFPDFIALIKQPGGLKTMILEVKPKKQCEKPVKPKRMTKRYINEVYEYGVNQAKWAAARAYCADRGWQFVVLTEEDIFGKRAK